MTNFADDLRSLIETLRGIEGVTVRTAEIGEPCSEAEISEVAEALGYRFGDHFLSYYRAANGARILWSSAKHRGGLDIQPLRTLPKMPPNIFSAEDCEEGNALRILGGIDERVARHALRVIDKHPKDGNEYPTVALLLDGRPEPVVIFPNDACASLDDSYPMLATSYFEMLLATAGHSLTLEGSLADRSAANTDFTVAYAPMTGEELNRWDRDAWSQLGGAGNYVRWLHTRDVPSSAPAMSKLSDDLRAGVGLDVIGPKRWIESRYGVVVPVTA